MLAIKCLRDVLPLLAVLALSVLSAGQVAAAQLTPEQIQLLQNMPAGEKAKLAGQSGLTGAQGGADKPVDATQNAVRPRDAGVGPMESQGETAADKTQLRALSETGPEQVIVRSGTALKEARHAFADFLAESKPLQVDASRLKQFGYDLFAGAPSTFAPATDVPVPPEYVLGPGDEMKVQLFGQKNDEFSLTVDRDGAVAFPEIGPVTLAGMGFADARALLAQQVRERMIGVTASITMGQLRSIRVFALGEVEQPGSYVVSGLATLSNALMVSGGVRKTGSLRHIQLKRQGKVVASIDLYRFLLHGDTKDDVRLLPGDVVFVPPVGTTVGIAGEVLRPAIYELGGQSTVGDLVSLAGGLLPKGYAEKSLLERINPNGEKTVLSFPLKGEGLRKGLRNGDVLKVFSSLDFEENPVLLIGNAKRPGKYAWSKGMQLSSLLPDTDALLAETFMDYGIIERESKGNREPEIIRFRLTDLFLPGKQAVDVELQSRDKVYVFNRSYFRIVPKVAVEGSVKSPGEYEIKKNMRLLDLVLAAGGVTRDSMMDKAELYRTDAQSKAVSVIQFPLIAVMQGDARYNLVLQDSDRVVVHSIWEKKRKEQVRIIGEVKNPGMFPMSDGMHLSELVFAAGSVTERALLKNAEVTRYKVVDGERRESKHFIVDLESALGGDKQADILLQPDDVVQVHPITNWRESERVAVDGEVRFPGSFPIEEGERLSDLLQRVGGFTDKAYLPAVVFTRESLRAEQQKQLDELSRRIDEDIARQEVAYGAVQDATIAQREKRSLDAAKRVLEQLKTVKATGRLVIHLSDLEHFKGSEFDVRLRDGDKLYVPQKPDQVMVIGQVYNQSAFVYQDKLDRDDYVEKTGGVTRFADSGHIYVVRASGEVDAHSGFLSKPIEPGDVIVVPEQLSQFNLVDSMLDWSRVMMQVGVGVAAMKTLTIL